MAAQRLWWQRSDGGAAMGRSDGAQQWQRRWRCSDGDGGAAMAPPSPLSLRVAAHLLLLTDAS